MAPSATAENEDNMSKRPRSVTIISWIFIVFGGLVFCAIVRPHGTADAATARYIADSQANHPFLWALFYAGPIVLVICGVLMLLGFGWARWLLHAWFGHNVVMKTIHSPKQFLAGAIFFGVAVYYLYRPQASAFFNARKALRSPKPPLTDNSGSQDATKGN